MRQAEIIEKLKGDAVIAVYEWSRKRKVVLSVNVHAKYPDRMEQYTLTYRQFQALYRKGVIDADRSESVKSQDKYHEWYYADFYYYTGE